MPDDNKDPKQGDPKPLTVVMDAETDIPETVRDLYTKDASGKFRLTGIAGVKTQMDVDTVLEAKRKEVNDHGETKKALGDLRTYLGDWSALAGDELTKRIAGYDELVIKAESAGKVTEDQIEKIVESRIKARIAPHERKVTELTTENGQLKTKVSDYAAADRKRTIQDKVREAMIGAKVLDTAHDDVFAAAERMLELTDEGVVLTRDGVGVSPGVDPFTWLIEMQQKRPHWWPASVGGNANGNDGRTPSFPKNPWTAEHWNLTEQGRYEIQFGAEKAEAARRAAGVQRGATRPAARK